MTTGIEPKIGSPRYPEAIISVLSDRNYMENLHFKFCFIKALQRSETAH